MAPAADVRAAIALHWHKMARRPRRRPLQPSLLHLPSSPAAASPHRPGACDCTCHAARPLAPPPPPPAVPWHQCAAVRAGCGCLFDGSRDVAALVAAYQSQQHAALWPWRADGCESDGDTDGGAHAPPAILAPSCGCCCAGQLGGSVAQPPSVAIMAAALPQAPLGLRRSPKRFLDLGASAGVQQQEERERDRLEEQDGPPPPPPVWRGFAPGAVSAASSASTDSTTSSSSSVASDPSAAYAQLWQAPPAPRLAASWPPLTAISLEDGPRGGAARRPPGGNPFAAAAAVAAPQVAAPPQWQPGGGVTGPWCPPPRVAGQALAPLQQQQQQEVAPARRHFGGRGAPWSTCLAKGGGSAGSATLAPSASPSALPTAAAQRENTRVHGPFGPAAAAAAPHGYSAATWALALRQATTRLREEAARQQQPPLAAAARGQQQQQQPFCGAAVAALDAEAAEPAIASVAADAGEMMVVSGCSASLQPSSRTSSDSSTTTMVDVSDL